MQKLAQNPEAVKNMTFDLKDPELGLLRNDGIEERHLKGAFSVDFEDTSQLAKGTATDVKFVDARSVSFDIKDQEDTIADAQKQITTLRDEKKGLQGELKSAQDELALAQRVIGGNAMQAYEQLTSRQDEITEALEGLDTQEAAYKEELSAEGTSPERKAELNHILKGIGEERKALTAEQQQHTEKLNKVQGPLLQRYALKDLPALQDKVEAKTEAIAAVDNKIKAQVRVVEGAVSPVSEAAKMPDKPAAADTAAAEEAVPVTPAAADDAAAADDVATPAGAEAVDAEAVQVGTRPELDALKAKPANHQAQQLKDMSTADQTTFVNSLSTEERAALKTEVEGFINKSESTSGARFRNANAKYKELLGVINGAPPAAAPAAADPAAADAGAAPVADAETTTNTTTTTTRTETRSSNVTVGQTGEEIPEGGLSRKSQPLKVNGAVVTKESFKSLAIQDKFDILMKADKEFLRDLLTSMSKEERSKIKTLARERISKYAGSTYSATATSKVRIQRNEDGTASFVTTHANGSQTVKAVSKEHQEEVERAQYILDIIAELDGEGSASRTTTRTSTTSSEGTTTTTTRRNTQPTEVDTSVATEGLRTVQYNVRPGETASSIAERQYGNRLRGQEILKLNPELEAEVKARAGDTEFIRVPLVTNSEPLVITILDKDEKALDDPVRNASPAQQQPAASRPRVVEEPVTPAPAAPQAEKPAPPPRAAS